MGEGEHGVLDWNVCMRIGGYCYSKAHIPLETGFASANSRVANVKNDAQTT